MRTGGKEVLNHSIRMNTGGVIHSCLTFEHAMITARKEVAKVMFLHVSVCPQGGRAWAGTLPRPGTPPEAHTPWEAHPSGSPPPRKHSPPLPGDG